MFVVTLALEIQKIVEQVHINDDHNDNNEAALKSYLRAHTIMAFGMFQSVSFIDVV